MTNIDPSLRKAAVLLRSLDADTAAMMLGQLSTEEAAAIRGAMRTLGAIESHEQTNVMAELRRARSSGNASDSGDVELSLSSTFERDAYNEPAGVTSAVGRSSRFEFLESAPTHALVPYLAREHAQTIAVVLSQLMPQRAAAVLAALPQKVQADTIERLSTLGETDPESVSVLERELEAWVAKREGSRAGRGRRRDTMAAILAAADSQSRSRILSNLKKHSGGQARHVTPRQAERLQAAVKAVRTGPRTRPATTRGGDVPVCLQTGMSAPRSEPRVPLVAFDELVKLDSRTLASVLRQVDANVLALALAGSRDEMVDRICEPMPKRTAREFRRTLRRLGPTRLSDVETAQHAVAQIVARQLAERQQALALSHG